MVSGCLFQKGTAQKLHNSFQRVRGHFSFLGGGQEQTCTLSLPYVFLPLPFLLQYTISASHLRFAIQSHKIAIPLSVAWPQLTSSGSEEARTRSSSLEKMGYKGESRTNSPATQRAGESGACPRSLPCLPHQQSLFPQSPPHHWSEKEETAAGHMSLCFESQGRHLCPHGWHRNLVLTEAQDAAAGHNWDL